MNRCVIIDRYLSNRSLSKQLQLISRTDTTIILLQDAVRMAQTGSSTAALLSQHSQVYLLESDQQAQGVSSSWPSISMDDVIMKTATHDIVLCL
ncbi:MAG: DsrH/TusB family sulfur metabolism protein [Pseudomonadota bacterium]|nr:DsrH/TusB family sulfur metabolism protein [Pseudomonadota bacterium]